jgi:hypothetical protein
MNMRATDGRTIQKFKKDCQKHFRELMKAHGIGLFEICDAEKGRRPLTQSDVEAFTSMTKGP